MNAIIVVFALGTLWCSKPMDYQKALKDQVELNNGHFVGAFTVIPESDATYRGALKTCRPLTGF